MPSVLERNEKKKIIEMEDQNTSQRHESIVMYRSPAAV